MAPYKSYLIRPQQHGIDVSNPSINAPFPFGYWGSLNFRIDQHSIQKPWGYHTADRQNLGNVQHIILYQIIGGTRYTCYLNDADLITKETSGSNTWSYTTDTYVTGNITDIVNDGGGAGMARVTGSGTAWNTAPKMAAGDKFIITAEHSPALEPDADWYTIESVDSDTSLDLTANHSHVFTGGSKTYKIRKVYTTLTNERWSWCVVNDKLVFTNGSTNVQYWDGVNTYATDLSASAIKARYCMEYANRLIIADHGTTRDPVGVAWSVNGDPTDWTGVGSGSVTFMETKDFIAGLGKVGANIIIYFKDSIIAGYRTPQANPAIVFPIYKRGVGCVAPYGIIEAMGTNFFIGRNDFYMMDGDTPRPIGEKIKDKFFDIVGYTEIKRTFGFENNITHEVIWIANTDEGKLAFVYDYRRGEWSVYEYGHDISGAGTGVI